MAVALSSFVSQVAGCMLLVTLHRRQHKVDAWGGPAWCVVAVALQVLKVWNGLTQILNMPLRAWLRYVVVCLMVFFARLSGASSGS